MSAATRPTLVTANLVTANAGHAGTSTDVRRQAALLKTGALQNVILNSANFSIIATDEKGVIQLFNIGAERTLGYTADEVMHKITPADIADPPELVARAAALGLELGTPIAPGFEALVLKASRGIDDIYELTYIRKDGTRFPAVVSVTALRDPPESIIGYLLLSTDNTELKRLKQKNIELEHAKLAAEKATQAASSLLARMCHDLSQPLQTLNLLQGLLMRRTKDDPDTLRLMGDMGDALAAVSGMLNRLRDIDHPPAPVEAQTAASSEPIPIKKNESANREMLVQMFLEEAGRADDAEDVAAGARAGEGDARRVLVAEDDRFNQMIVSTVLGRAGYMVDYVENGEEAVAALERTAYDLVLMDDQMPLMTGSQAVRHIRAMPCDKARLPIIALTAHAMQGARENYLAHGFDDYLSKPFTPAALLAVIRRWADAAERREPAADPGFEGIIEGLRREFRSRLAADCAAIERLWPLVVAGRDDGWPEAARVLQTIVHRLIGTAGSVGFNEISELGAAVVSAAGSPAGVVAMAPLIERLLEACRRDALAGARGLLSRFRAYRRGSILSEG